MRQTARALILCGIAAAAGSVLAAGAVNVNFVNATAFSDTGVNTWDKQANLDTIAARSAGASCGQSLSSNARRATSTAVSTSAVVPSGTRPTSSSECGEITSIVVVPFGATHSPPMNSRSYSRTVAPLFRDRSAGR